MQVNFDAYKSLNGQYLKFPAFAAAHDQITENLNLYRKTGVAEHVMILGESGTGKTSLAKLFVAQYPRSISIDRDRIPVLWVSIPAAATIDATAEAILNHLGDPASTGGTISKKTNRLVKLSKGVGVEMLLLDEAQHIYDRGRTTTQYFVGDWLKTVMDDLAVPVCMLGLPRAAGLMQINDQLRRRFVRKLSLAVYVEGRDSGHDACAELFCSLAGAIGVSLSTGSLSWESLATRLHFASDSRIAYVRQLLLGSHQIAVNEGIKVITPEVLERAFKSSIWADGVGQLNPFNIAFELRRLDRLGEPFQQVDLANRLSVKRKK